MPKRLSILLLCVGSLLAALLAVPTAAGATPPTVRLVGSVVNGTSAAAPVKITYTITVTGSIDNAQLETTVFDSAPVDPATVEVGGSTVPSGTVSVLGRAMTIRLGVGADSVNGGTLADGTTVVSYLQARPTDAGAYPTTSGTLYFQVAGGPTSISSAALVLAHPDLIVTAPGESAVLPLGTGRTAGFGADIRNPGATSTATTVRIALPTGLRIDPSYGVLRYNARTDDGVRIKCTGTTKLTCAFGTVAHLAHETLIVPVQPTKAARPGTVGRFFVTATPTDEADQVPANNTVHGRVRFTGIAVLHFALVPASTKVKIGSTDRLSLRITNDGPQAASVTVGLAVIEPQHFTIANYSTARNVPGPDMFRLPLGTRFGGAIVWNAGTVPAHRTVYAQVTVKAVTAGTARVVFYGQSDAGNPACDADGPRCAQVGMATLTAVK